MQFLALAVDKLCTAATLWWSGVVESLQLQRCVVYFVLDRGGRVLSKVNACLLLNGVIYLGSILVDTHLTQPAAAWLLTRYAEPLYGTRAVRLWRLLLQQALHLLWLLPTYLICLCVNSHWYNQLAVAAFEVETARKETAAAERLQQQQQQRQLDGHKQPLAQQQHDCREAVLGREPSWLVEGPGQGSGTGLAPPGGAGGGAGALAGGGGRGGGGSSGGGAAAALEGVAQELYRVVFFLVFSVEVFLISKLPYVGGAANLLFLSWLYSYYVFDYSWALCGLRLAQRLDAVERHWAFFAGFGFPCTLATVYLPFHVGAALLNLLFPLLILVATSADPGARNAELGVKAKGLGAVRVFSLALWPSDRIVSRIFGAGGAAQAARR